MMRIRAGFSNWIEIVSGQSNRRGSSTFGAMHLVDTHAHLYLPQFDEDREAMIQRAIEAGVEKIFLPNIDLDTIPLMHSLCDRFPQNCFPMMGLHPCDVNEDFQSVLAQMRLMFSERKYWAVGETGIDLYWDKTKLDLQIASFKIQIEWAKELSLPIVIHARESFDEIFSVLDEVNDERLTGVFHCFTGNEAQAKHIDGYGGFMFGFGGVLTHEKSGLSETVKQIQPEKIVLETDSPFLAPMPHRGKRNESAYVRIVVEKLATVLGRSIHDVESITTRNSERLFGF
ncbi:MAG: TatD family hydrolase [Flavobacteriales bacterium]|nr:TatD family hydrolase [Flavobacteriales bacterium]